MNLTEIREAIKKKANGRENLYLDEVEIICCNISARIIKNNERRRKKTEKTEKIEKTEPEELIYRLDKIKTGDSVYFKFNKYIGYKTPFHQFVRNHVRGQYRVSITSRFDLSAWELKKVDDIMFSKEKINALLTPYRPV